MQFKFFARKMIIKDFLILLLFVACTTLGQVCFQPMVGKDFSGSIIRQYFKVAPDECARLCGNEPKCVGYTYKAKGRFESAWCYLKSTIRTISDNERIISGRRLAQVCSSVVHVSEERGADTGDCGTARSPCKTLGLGVAKVNVSGTVSIEGNQQINQTITVMKNVTIRALKNRSILSSGISPKKLPYAFETYGRKINITFDALEVRNIGLLKGRSSENKGSLSFRISNCYFIRTAILTWTTKQVSLYDSRKFTYINFSIENSTFENTEVIGFTWISVSFVIKNSIFNKTRGIKFGDIVMGKLLNSLFHETALDAEKCKHISIKLCRFNRTSYLQFRSLKRFRYTRPPTLPYIKISDSILTGAWDLGREGKGLHLEYFHYVKILRCKISYVNFQNDRQTKAPVNIIASNNASISDVKCENNEGSLRIGGCIYVLRNVGTVEVQNSQFRGNIARRGGAIFAERSKLIVLGCEFYKNFASDGGSVHIVGNKYEGSFEVRRSNFTANKASTRGGSIFTEETRTLVSYCSFFNSSSENFGGGIAVIGGTLSINNCKFRMNSALTAGGAISFENGYSRAHEYIALNNSFIHQCRVPAISIDCTTILVLNTILRAHDDTISPHIKLRGEQITIESFQTIVTYPKTVQSNLVLTVMKATSLNAGPLSFSGIDLPTGLNLTCSPNFNAEVTNAINSEGLNETTVESKCVSCPPNMYTISNKYNSKNFSVVPSCLNCPPGASCNGVIRSQDNFWGRKVGDEIMLFPCPSGFCCSSQSTPCLSYNTCNKGRTGVFCGSCDKNHMQSYMTASCIPRGNRQCNPVLFIIYFVLTSLACTTIFTFLPRMIEIVKLLGSKCVKKSHVEENPNDDIDEDEPFPFAAFVTMVIFFFQIASLVHVDMLEQKKETKNESNAVVMQMIFELFNFRMAISQKLCPTNNLTLIDKLFINISLKVSTIFNLLFFFMVWKFFQFLKCCKKGNEATSLDITHQLNPEMTKFSISTSPDVIEDEPVLFYSHSSASSPLSFTSQLKIGFIKLVKLNFLAVASILFHLVHCEKIGEQLHLYRFGDQQCYTWWQYLIFATVLPAVITFPILFGKLLDLLKHGLISSNMFTASCLVPFLVIWPYFKKGSHKSSKRDCAREEERCVKEILDMEETLFRSDDSGLRWPIVQLYRNLLVVVIDTFVLSPVFKSLWYSVLFLVFYTHDWYRMPYRNAYLNHLQKFTSAALFLVILCSVPSTFSSVGDVTALPGMPVALLILGYLEKALYATVLITLPIWKLWMRFQNKKERQQNDIN